MKIQNINKLILKFIGGGIIKVPVKYIKGVDIETNDNSDFIEVKDLEDINISIVNDRYFENNTVGKTFQIDELLNIEPFDTFTKIMLLKTNYDFVFNTTNSYSENYNGYNTQTIYNHTITLKPGKTEYNIELITTTEYKYEAGYNGPTEWNSKHITQLMLNEQNLLEVKNITEEFQSQL